MWEPPGKLKKSLKWPKVPPLNNLSNNKKYMLRVGQEVTGG